MVVHRLIERMISLITDVPAYIQSAYTVDPLPAKEVAMLSCSLIRRALIPIGLLIAATAVYAESAPSTADATFALFRNPPAEYRCAPLWVWNDRVSEAEIDEQLRDFNSRGIGGVFIHPRPGLITPYLSDEWLDRWAYAVKVGKALGMKIWIYDENSYPSGFAGGHVPAAMPDAVMVKLRMTHVDNLPNPLTPETMLVLMREGDHFIDITKTAAEHTGAGEYRLFDLRKNEPSAWLGGFSYVDIMRRDVTEKFLEVTLDAYKRTVGDEFGKTVPGSFQDEAILLPGGVQQITYTPALFDAFRAKWGYDLRTNLPSLYEEVGDWKRVRHNYQSVVLNLLIENWARPYYEYCARNNLIFTGHYWEHEWPYPRYNPDNLAMAAWSHMPGIDVLENDWSATTHAQFGNARAVKEIRSAANQFGRSRTLSETYGAAGWDLTFNDQKRIGDWEYALGVNFLNQHLSFMTIMGARKRDHPLSFSYHEPWWNTYGVLADYFGRLSVAMSAGRQDNRILVLEPTTSAWMYAAMNAQPHQFNNENPRLNAIGDEFQDFVNLLEKHQVEYDLGSEDILHNHGSVEGKALKVGLCRYELVILPSGMENLNAATMDLLSRYLAGGGNILAWTTPAFVDGKESEEPGKLAARYPSGWRIAVAGESIEAINHIIPPELIFENVDSITGTLFHQRRVLIGGQIIFLVNTSDRDASKGRFTVAGGSIERWDPFTGAKSPYSFTRAGNRLSVNFDLPPGGSILLCAYPAVAREFLPPESTETALTSGNPLSITRESPNVLTLDYCDLTLDGKTERDLFFYEAQQKTFRHHGLPRNPWDSAVQYKTSILDLDHFPPDSGFEALYRFTVAPGVSRSGLRVVIERPAIFTVTLNGTQLAPKNGEWWLDKSFGVYDIGAAAKVGENILTVNSSPFTIFTELEPVYLLGDFRLESREKGFTIIPDGTVAMGPWNTQGMPFYAGGVRYGRGYTVTSPNTENRRYIVRLGEWKGSFAEVAINGKPVGIIAFRPFELDVTEYVTPGTNHIAVIVYGTLKNTLGPHHGNPPLGRARTNVFLVGAKDGCPPGSQYNTGGYGLMDDFQFVEVNQAR